MQNYEKFIISENAVILEALKKIDEIAKVPHSPLCLFVEDENKKIIGSVTDGDIRRSMLNGGTLKDNIRTAIRWNFNYLRANSFDINYIKELREKEILIVPMLDDAGRMVKLIDIKNHKSVLPLDAVIMAGGLGERLRPFTDTVPKPLIKLGDKALIDYNIDWLTKFGINNYHITINYLGEKIVEHLGDGAKKDVNINYIKEDEPLGTAGSISLINKFENEDVLVLNSDILTNIDYEGFYQSFIEEEADMAIASTHYTRNIPYAVFETDGSKILSFREKPSYNYISNAGIYLVKKHVLDMIPKNGFFNMIDLIEPCIEKNLKVTYYPILGYWLDVGNMGDLAKAQCDIKNIRFA